MNKIKRQYLPFTKAGIQTTMMYSINFIFRALSELLYCFVMFYLWKAVFESSGGDTFMGFDMNDMTLYLFMSNITACLTSSSADNTIASEIQDGSISMRLIKPINLNMSYLFADISTPVVMFFAFSIPTLTGLEIYRFIVNGEIMFNITNFLLYLLSAVLAYMISFYINMCFGFIAFYVTNLWGMGMLKKILLKFLSGSVIPFAFLPDIMKNIMSLLPFASLGYIPVMIYMGKYSTEELVFNLILQLFWVLMLSAVSKLVWRGAIKHLCVQGG